MIDVDISDKFIRKEIAHAILMFQTRRVVHGGVYPLINIIFLKNSRGLFCRISRCTFIMTAYTSLKAFK